MNMSGAGCRKANVFSAPSHFSGRSTLLFCLLSQHSSASFYPPDLVIPRQRSTSCCIILPRTPVVSLSTLLAEQGRQARAGTPGRTSRGRGSSDIGAAAAAVTRCVPPLGADPADTDGTQLQGLSVELIYAYRQLICASPWPWADGDAHAQRQE